MTKSKNNLKKMFTKADIVTIAAGMWLAWFIFADMILDLLQLLGVESSWFLPIRVGMLVLYLAAFIHFRGQPITERRLVKKGIP